jgi:nucleotidyltransferase substrate binding protein (TIGR01987 family)
MERLRLKLQDAKNALAALETALREPFSLITRDASIQRFEYTFEALWKLLKEYLKTKEGIVSTSPKACFREAFSAGLLQEHETVLFMEMTDRRNETSHTYKAAVAEALYSALRAYPPLMRGLIEKLEGKL